MARFDLGQVVRRGYPPFGSDNCNIGCCPLCDKTWPHDQSDAHSRSDPDPSRWSDEGGALSGALRLVRHAKSVDHTVIRQPTWGMSVITVEREKMKRFETNPPLTAVPRASDVAASKVDFDFADLGPGAVPPLGHGGAAEDALVQGVLEQMLLKLSAQPSDLPERAAAALDLHFPDHSDFPDQADAAHDFHFPDHSDLPQQASAAHDLHFPDHADLSGVPTFVDDWA